MAAATSYKRISGEMKAMVAQTVREVLEDPDFGLELSSQAKKRLRAAATSKRKTISLSEVKKKHY